MIRVLIGDTSAVSRSIEKDIIKQNSRFGFCGEAGSEQDFLSKIETLRPDALVVDSALFSGKRVESIIYLLEKTKLPALLYVPQEFVNISSSAGIRLLTKPSFASLSTKSLEEYSNNLEQILSSLKHQIHYQEEQDTFERIYQSARAEEIKTSNKNYMAVCIGVSTGGPGTIHELLKSIGSNFPLPIFITQHIDSFFDKNLIVWLNANCPMPVHLAENNVKPLAGHVYFAPSDFHLTFLPSLDGTCLLRLNKDAPVNFLRPAVDKMFESAASVFGDRCIGVLLTGMGADGAKGCVQIKQKGGYVIGQDEKSCVVYGMPKAALEAGGVTEVLSLDKIGLRIKQLAKAVGN